MAYSYKNYVGDGSTVNFSVTYPYLMKSHVKVYVQGILKTIDVDYTWLNAGTIQFDSAPLEDEVVSLIRSSGRTARLVDYQTGSILEEKTLDKDSNQLFYLMQEAFDALVSASGEDSAIFSTPAAILDAFQGAITGSQLTADLASAVGYLVSNYDRDPIYEFDIDGTVVYEDGIYAYCTSRLDVAEDKITINVSDISGHDARIVVVEDQVTINVSDISGHTDDISGHTDDITGHAAILALMADEFYVKLDNHGNVAGFGLYNGETSQFIVNADQFAIIKADGSGDTKVPFIVDTETSVIGIDGTLVVTGSITAAKIAAEAIEAGHMAADSILAASIKAGEIDTGHLAADCITATEIDALAVDTEHLAADCITAAKIAALAVEAGHIAADAVTATEINVATLHAIVADLGTITAGNITLDSNGFIRTVGKDNYADATAGLFLGYDGEFPNGEYKFNLGTDTHHIKWDGETMYVAGEWGGVLAGDAQEAGATSENYTYSESYVKKKEILIARSGTWRITFHLKIESYTVFGRIYKNGAAYGTERSTTYNTYQTFSEDLIFQAGDLVQLYVKVENGSVMGYYGNFLLKCYRLLTSVVTLNN